MAAERVQPLPWVFSVKIFGASRTSKRFPSYRTSKTLGPARCPPFTSTYWGPRALTARAASFIPSRSSIFSPQRIAASSRLGVTTVAKGMRSVFTASTASSSRRRWLVADTMTGSTTRFRSRNAPTSRATAPTISFVASMPVLPASAPISERTDRIWSVTKSGARTWTPCTPRVFCAVMAVRTDRPYTPKALKVLRSAWIPAPPPESEPAMVMARRIAPLRISAPLCPTSELRASLVATARRGRIPRLLRPAVEGAVTVIAPQDPFHVAAGFRIGDLFDEYLWILGWLKRIEPASDDMRSGVVGGEGQDQISSELLMELGQVAGSERDVGSGGVEVGEVPKIVLLGHLRRGGWQKLHESPRSRPGEGLGGKGALFADDGDHQIRVETALACIVIDPCPEGPRVKKRPEGGQDPVLSGRLERAASGTPCEADAALELARPAERLAGLPLERQLTGVRPGNLPVLVSGLVPESQEGELSSLGHDRGRGIVGGQKRVNR